MNITSNIKKMWLQEELSVKTVYCPFETDVVNEKGVYWQQSVWLNLFVWGNNSCLNENSLTGHS